MAQRWPDVQALDDEARRLEEELEALERQPRRSTRSSGGPGAGAGVAASGVRQPMHQLKQSAAGSGVHARPLAGGAKVPLGSGVQAGHGLVERSRDDVAAGDQQGPAQPAGMRRTSRGSMGSLGLPEPSPAMPIKALVNATGQGCAAALGLNRPSGGVQRAVWKTKWVALCPAGGDGAWVRA
jgi:hypothetical protein